LTRLILVVIIGAIAGCSTLSLPLPSRPSSTLLAQADRLLGEGQYTDALEVYGEVVTKYPNTDDAARARARHDTIAGLLAARSRASRGRSRASPRRRRRRRRSWSAPGSRSRAATANSRAPARRSGA
jgi:outer membrane protein assembly factor BamD (BamD/ComL family)